NDLSMSIMSLKLMSSVSIFYRLATGASSHITTFAFLINLTTPLFFYMFVIVDSFVCRGISNLECVIRPPDKIEVSMPLVVVAKSIIPLDLTLISNARDRYRYVFLVPQVHP
ncbi:hypothetical protein EJD97_024560, partial [Solanum chilense]